jgi:hypothetical protein
MIWCLDEGVIKNLGDRAWALSILHKMYSVLAVYDSMWQFYIPYSIVMMLEPNEGINGEVSYRSGNRSSERLGSIGGLVVLNVLKEVYE